MKLKTQHFIELESPRLTKIIRKLYIINQIDRSTQSIVQWLILETFQHSLLQELDLQFVMDHSVVKEFLQVLLNNITSLTSLKMYFYECLVNEKVRKWLNTITPTERGYYETIGQFRVQVWLFHHQ